MGRWRTAEEENWVAEWFLWHSFRFRDNRNNQAATQHTAGGHTSSGGGAGHGGEPLSETLVENEVRLTLLQLRQTASTGAPCFTDIRRWALDASHSSGC